MSGLRTGETCSGILTVTLHRTMHIRTVVDSDMALALIYHFHPHVLDYRLRNGEHIYTRVWGPGERDEFIHIVKYTDWSQRQQKKSPNV